MSKVEIRPLENGPNVVPLDSRVLTAMCRCRATNNQPYCDGTHAKIHFSAGPTEFEVLNH